MVNIYDTETDADNKWRNCIAERLQISFDHIAIVNKRAIDFFNQDMRVEVFSSLFPEENAATEVLPS